ncbi:MAG: HAMP domain-containing histidine kinase [Oscillospiraceae bacterium]|nr:HAMP domain-containing histidine kinase [Oscillospiraceae bacterium]
MRKQSRLEKVPFPQSMQFKFVMSYFAIIAAVLVLLNTYPLIASQDMVFKSKSDSLQRQAASMAVSLGALESLTAEGVSQVMEVLDDGSLTRVIVTDASGLILYDTSKEADNRGRYALLQEIVLALNGPSGNDVARTDYKENAFRSRAAIPILYRGMLLGAVYLYEYDSQQAAILQDLQSTLRNLSAIIGVLACLISMLFSRTLARRIGQLLSGIRSVREGEYTYRVELAGRDEISALAGEFNRLTERLQTTDEVRRRFVSDASHELKTPLASIRLLTDSILQSEHMDGETSREFVSDIGEEADRLSRITEKLLALTRLDNGVDKPAERVDLSKTVENVLHMLSMLAREKEIRLSANLDKGGTVLANGDDLYQIVFNLVENGIKYNQPGGQVRVQVRKRPDWVVLRVEDDGIGIGKEDLKKVFDRFYRVDKARSREAGGTGLGLSIVKDTARRHGGVITAGSELGEGTWFQVKFPAAGEEGEK